MNEHALIGLILRDFPATQAIYLYGSFAHGTQTQKSDIDLAVLLPHRIARQAGMLALHQTHLDLESIARRTVDLVNLRLVPVVLQNQVVFTGRVIYVADDIARQEFEMLSLSFYMKLNEERAGILKAFRETKRAYSV